MENTLPRSLNKIIEEYCCFPIKFEDELLHKTEKIRLYAMKYRFYDLCFTYGNINGTWEKLSYLPASIPNGKYEWKYFVEI